MIERHIMVTRTTFIYVTYNDICVQKAVRYFFLKQTGVAKAAVLKMSLFARTIYEWVWTDFTVGYPLFGWSVSVECR